MAIFPPLDMDAPGAAEGHLGEVLRKAMRLQDLTKAPSALPTVVGIDSSGALKQVFDAFLGGYQSNRVLKMACLGDSRSGVNLFHSPTRIPSAGWAFWAALYSRGRVDVTDPALNFGVSGDNSGQILSRVPDVLATDCDVVAVLSSVNDPTGMASADNVEATVMALLAGGKIVIVIPELPRVAGWSNARIAQHLSVHQRCRALAQTLRGCYIADPWAAMADPATGGIAAGMYYDIYVHLTKLGNSCVGKAIADVLIKLVPEPSILPAVNVGGYDSVYNPLGNINNNPLMTGTAGSKSGTPSGDVADGWVLTGTTDLTVVASKVTIAGVEWQQIVISGTATDAAQYVELSQNIPTAKLQIGDVLRAVVDLQVDGSAANVHGPMLEITGSGGLTSYVSVGYDTVNDTALDTPNVAYAGVMVTPPIAVKAGLSALKVNIKVKIDPDAASALTFRVRAGGLAKQDINPSPVPIPVLNVIARMSPAPNAARETLINQLYSNIGSVIYKLDALYVHAAHAQQGARLNWVAAAYDLTENSSPAWVPDGYYAGDGSTSYLSSGYNPAIASGLYQPSDAHMGVWMLTKDSSSAISAIGNTNARIGMNASDALGMRANEGSGFAGAVAGLPAYALWSRSSSGAFGRYKNGVRLAEIGAATPSMTSAEFTICRAGSTFVTNQIAISHWGKSLSDEDVAALYSAFNTYLSSL